METFTNDTEDGSFRAPRQPEITALAIVWSREEPERIGEVLLPAFDAAHAGPVVFGRATDDASEGALPHLALFRQRPGRTEATGPTTSRKISRQQLKISARDDGILELENLGRRALFVNGQEVKRQRQVREGDIVELRGALMFLVTPRPRVLPGAELPRELWPPFGQADAWGMIGESPAIWALRAKIAFVAEHDVHTLVNGPSGTGKELVAAAIHGLSRRREAALVARNAATFPASLIDAELFGNIRDYPNPGTPARSGLIGAAHGSSLFLDEIGELPHELQAHLLRVLDAGEYQRLGDSQRRHADLRLIAATNRQLHELKHDFLARMRMRLEVPGLDARREDIGLLIPALIRKAASDDSTSLAAFFPDDDIEAHPRVDAGFVRTALAHDYRTHVRELEATLWAGMMRSATEGLRHVALEAPLAMVEDAPDLVDPDALTRAQLLDTMRGVDGVKERAWRLLGLRNRFQLNRLLKRHGIGPDDL